MEQVFDDAQVVYLLPNQQYIEQLDLSQVQVYEHNGNYYVPSSTMVLQDDTEEDITKLIQIPTEIELENTCDDDSFQINDSSFEDTQTDEPEPMEITDITEVIGKNILTGRTITIDNCLESKLEKTMNNLLNKTIELGTTLNGKRLFGRILEITRPEVQKTVQVVAPSYVEIVSRTLAGLMDMESMRDEFIAKPLTIKLCDKPYGVTNIARLHGCMQRGEDGWQFLYFDNPGNDDVAKEIAEARLKLRYITVLNVTMELSHNNIIPCRVTLHPNPNLFTCIICYKELKNEKNLQRHYSTHHGDNFTGQQADNYMCTICNRNFQSSSSFKRHKAVHNPDLRVLECNICKARFTETTSLKRHILSHVGIKPFRCDICQRAFTNVGDLNGHQKTHLGAHNFSCNVCGRKFTRQTNMMRHAEIHKNGVHVCHLCGCSYQHLSSLTRHTLQAHLSSNDDNEEQS